jgi:hypothetical protein
MGFRPTIRLGASWLCVTLPSLPQAFGAWMQALVDLRQDIVTLDGTTIRRSLDRAEGTGPMHVVHAWASANEVGLAQGKVDAKTNAITALPALLRLRNVAGAVVTISLGRRQAWSGGSLSAPSQGAQTPPQSA